MEVKYIPGENGKFLSEDRWKKINLSRLVPFYNVFFFVLFCRVLDPVLYHPAPYPDSVAAILGSAGKEGIKFTKGKE